VNKLEFIRKLAEKTGFTQKDTEKFFNAHNETIMQTLSDGEKVQIIGFGSYEVRHRKSREGRDPRTGETVSIPAKMVPAFKPGKQLKEAVDK
jgi:DNA-binding protein HU-beta